MFKKLSSILFEYSGFLILGAAIGLVWANLAAPAHEDAPSAVVETKETHAAGEGNASEISGEEEKATPVTPEHDNASAVATGHEEEKHEDGETHEDAHGGHGGGHASHSSYDKFKHDILRFHLYKKKDFNLHFLINELLMAFFFAIAGKEVWEALLPGGALSSPKKAATPLMATIGGMVGPAGLYVAGVLFFKEMRLMNGWAIPCATDIAFSYLAARIIFGSKHPAIPFLLLLAIADDAGGLIILATCYPSGDIPMNLPAFFGLVIPAVLIGFGMRKMKIKSWIPYILIPGTISWLGFFFGGIEPALGLIPVIPTLPHAHTDLGIFCKEELKREDPLNKFEHDMKIPVELILGLFGLANAGVLMSNAGLATGLVTFGLIVGKPLGITLLTLIAVYVMRLQMPEGMNWRDLFTVGVAASIGFTVALFVSTKAFGSSDKAILDAAGFGALLSFFGFALTIFFGKILGVKKVN